MHLILTLEGPDGAGKSTLVRNLARALPRAVVMRQPGGTPLGEALRPLMKTARAEDPACVALLMQAARVASWRREERALADFTARGEATILLRDRSHHSTLVYQAGVAHVDTLVSVGAVPAPNLDGARHALVLCLGAFDKSGEVGGLDMTDDRARVRAGYRALAPQADLVLEDEDESTAVARVVDLVRSLGYGN